ncbi:unnamed protein product [Sympodiomycopsis kandeliae]
MTSFLFSNSAIESIEQEGQASSILHPLQIAMLFSGRRICPSGLSGNNCAQATCDSPYIPAASRQPKAANQKTCAKCTDGFSGLNCNVCSNAAACTRASNATGYRPTLKEGTWISMRPDTDTFIAKSTDLTCHQQPKAYTTTRMECDLEQETLSGLFPGDILLTMTKVVDIDKQEFTGMPPVNGSAQLDSTYAEVWLDGALQFYCQATQCSSKNGSAIDNGKGRKPTSKVSDQWRCENMACSCIPGSTMCGSGDTSLSSGIALAPVINSLNGTFEVPCNYIDDLSASKATTSCQFKAGQLTSLLGSAGVPLENCRFGSCMLVDQLSHGWNAAQTSSPSSSQHVSGPIAGGIAVLSALLAALAGLLICGMIQRHRASFRTARRDIDPLVGLKWENVNYSLGKPTSSRALSDWMHPVKRSRKDQEAVEYELNSNISSNAYHRGGLTGSDVLNRSGSIIRGLSGTVPPGHLVAILGPSGAGKTTLVELLAGLEKRGAATGKIVLQAELDELRSDFAQASEQGKAVKQLPSVLADSSGRRLLAFVDQSDQLPALLTVREALLFAAELSLPESIARRSKEASVDKVIETLGLEAIQHSRIGSDRYRSISGGEIRRVSIGVALVANPRVLILDEPLSGLDAYNALRVVGALRTLAHKSVGATTVLLTLHQPNSEIFHKLDKAIVMTQGRIIYDGSPGDALQWCAANGRSCPAGFNVADHLLDIAVTGVPILPRKPSGEECMDSSREKTLARGNANDPEQHRHSYSTGSARSFLKVVPNRVHTSRLTDIDVRTVKATAFRNASTVWFTQLVTLLRRHLVTLRRDKTGAFAHVILHIVVGAVAGGAFFQVSDSIGGFQNRIGAIYLLYLMMAFASMSAITHLASWRPLVVRERANCLYTSSIWLSAHALYDLFFWRLIPGTLLLAIMYPMVGLRKSAKYFFEFLLVANVFSCVIALYMMILAALLEDMSIAVLLGGAFILFNIGMGGFLLNLATIPKVLRWIQWLCPLKYALEAIAINETDGLQINDTVSGAKVSVAASAIAPSLFSLEGSYHRDLLILALGWLPGFAVVLLFAAWWKVRDMR